MTQRVITLLICLSFAFIANGQTPQSPRVNGPISHTPGTLNTSSSACAPGQAPFAGTFTQSLGPGSQSNDIMYLCFGDVLVFDHAGDFNLDGDPDTNSEPGIAYGLYSCPPTVTGPDLNTIVVTDLCLYDDPPPPGAGIWLAPSDDFTAGGDGPIVNEGEFQVFFNDGNPIEIIFAPITVDDFIPGSPGWEVDGIGGLAGPCVHANVDEAFSIIFLNEIQLVDLDNNAGGNGCTGTATVTGGLPEITSTNYVINIFLTADPSVIGHSANSTNTTHDELFTFDVPTPGEYTIEVIDPNGCSSSFPVSMGSCQPVTLEMGDSIAAPGSVFCMPITVQDYNNITSLEITISWDASIMTFIPEPNGVNGINIPDGDIGVGPSVVTDSIRINTFNFSFTPLSIPDGEVAFEVCFDIIGPLGSSSFIRIEDNVSTEITGDIIAVPGSRVGYIFNEGSVLVTDGSLLISVSTICASPTAPAEGGFNFSVSGGSAPYDYTYEQVGMPTNNGAGTLLDDGELAAITALPPGDYTISVTDAADLTTMTTVTVVQTNTNFGAQPVAMNPTCATNMDGSVTLNIAGGVPPYTVIWSNGITNMNIMASDMIVDLPVGNYSATVIDANSCQAGPFSTSLIVSSVLVDSLSLQHVTCVGGPMDGNITVGGAGGAGGTGPYTFLWDDTTPGSTTPSISGLSPRIYCVTINDVNMCPDVRCFEILAPIEPTIDGFDVTQVECPNDMTGALTVNVTEGNTAIANIAWNTGANGPTITDLGPGEYKVTVTAVDGCVDSSLVTLTTPDEIALAEVVTPPTCPGDSDGQIQLMISGATMPYSITWDDGSSVNPRFALPCDSTYFVTITGANGCDTIKQEIFLDCPPPIDVVFSDTMRVNCFNGDCNGEALATAFGGTSTAAVYNYQWESGESDMNTVNSKAVQLCRGWNTILINDNACSIVDSVFINSPSEITLPLENIAIDNASCQGDSDGMITIAASGGTPGYNYIWEDGTTGPTLGGLAAGQYDVTITDANFCEEPKNITVGEPALFEVLVDTAQLQQVLCPADSSGIIVVFPAGGNAGIIDYQWTDDVSTSSVGINLKAGTYSIVATDPKGCTDDILVTLEEPDPIEFNIGDIVEPQCFGFQTVVTIDTAFGGNGPLYEFSVNNGPRVPIQGAIRVLGGQPALITVFDRSGCQVEEDIVINQPAQIVVDLGEDIEIQLGESAELDPFIGSILPVDSIVWQPLVDLVCMDSAFCLDVTVAPLETQMYSLTIFDENGCSGSDDILVEIDKNRNVFIPNAFSPNGDGNNDFFKPYIGPGVENINFMRVFDRWGEVLYSSDNLTDKYLPSDLDQTGWDGTLNGKRMNPGVYVYIMQVQFVDGQVLLYRGDITLLY